MKVEENLPIALEVNSGWDKRIEIVKCGDLVRAYVIKAENFTVVYDTLLGPKSGTFLREVALKPGKPLIVINSHADWDHYFGNMCFPEPILSSQIMVDRLRQGVGEKELGDKKKEFPECYGGVRLVHPQITFSEGGKLEGGDLSFHLLPSQGHRAGHLALYIPEIETLLPGDCVEDPIPLVDEDSDEKSNTLEELIGSLEDFLKLQPKWVLANHAPPENNTSRIESNISYLKKLQTAARDSASLDEFKESLPSEPSWDDFYQKAHNNQVVMAWQQK